MFYTEGDAFFVLGLLLLHVIVVIGSTILAERKNRNAAGWCIGTFFFGGIAFFFLLCSGKREKVK